MRIRQPVHFSMLATMPHTDHHSMKYDITANLKLQTLNTPTYTSGSPEFASPPKINVDDFDDEFEDYDDDSILGWSEEHEFYDYDNRKASRKIIPEMLEHFKVPHYDKKTLNESIGQPDSISESKDTTKILEDSVSDTNLTDLYSSGTEASQIDIKAIADSNDASVKAVSNQ